MTKPCPVCFRTPKQPKTGRPKIFCDRHCTSNFGGVIQNAKRHYGLGLKEARNYAHFYFERRQIRKELADLGRYKDISSILGIENRY